MTDEQKKMIYDLPLFAGVERETAKTMLSDPQSVDVEYAKGDVIFDSTDFRRALAVVLSGQIRVTKKTADGSDLVMSTLYPGALFGAASLYNGDEPYPSVLTAGEKCRIAFFPQEIFRAAMISSPRLAENYISYLSGRILFLNRRLYCLTAGTAEQKLASFMAENMPEGEKTPLPASMTDLAKSLNMGRASLYRAMDALERAGAITRSGNIITIKDKKILSEV